MSAELRLSRSRMDLYNSTVPAVTSPLEAALTELLRRSEGATWAVRTAEAVAVSPTFGMLAAPYAAAARKLRTVRLDPTEGEAALLTRLGGEALVAHGAPSVLRALLLLSACVRLPAADRVDLVDRVFGTGDNDERAALLRTLPFLPEPQIHLATAVEACRTNVRDVFTAIACENDYPSRWFTEAAFNQMVMKALFCEVELGRIRGLDGRVNAELRRMAADYAAERRAAGRRVPNDIGLYLDGRSV